VEDGENCAGRIAFLELSGEWMGKKILLCALFVCFQGIIENELESGGRGGGGGSGVRVRHKGSGSGSFCSSVSGGEDGNTDTASCSGKPWETIRLDAIDKRAK
jgi:hypothetical protein